jgi:serine/threonine protein kinase
MGILLIINKKQNIMNSGMISAKMMIPPSRTDSRTSIQLKKILNATHEYYEKKDIGISKAPDQIKLLFDQIIQKTSSYDKEKEECDVFKNKLEKKICKMFSKYYPAPYDRVELGIDRALVSDVYKEGVNGKIYKYALKDKYIIKGNKQEISQEVINDLIVETFINFVCINDYIIKTGSTNFVPTYGYFICDDFSICTDKKPNSSIFLIQPKIENAQSLGTYLIQKLLTINQCIYIFFKVLDIMIGINEFGDYHLMHGDLHQENILLIPDSSKLKTDDDYFDVKIIDWGMASFVSNQIRYYNWFEKETMGKYLKIPLMSALYDVFLLTSRFKKIAELTRRGNLATIFFKMRDILFPVTLDKSNYANQDFFWHEFKGMLRPPAVDQKKSDYISSVIEDLNTYTYRSIRDRLIDLVKVLKKDSPEIFNESEGFKISFKNKLSKSPK